MRKDLEECIRLAVEEYWLIRAELFLCGMSPNETQRNLAQIGRRIIEDLEYITDRKQDRETLIDYFGNPPELQTVMKYYDNEQS